MDFVKEKKKQILENEKKIKELIESIYSLFKLNEFLKKEIDEVARQKNNS